MLGQALVPLSQESAERTWELLCEAKVQRHQAAMEAQARLAPDLAQQTALRAAWAKLRGFWHAPGVPSEVQRLPCQELAKALRKRCELVVREVQRLQRPELAKVGRKRSELVAP